MAAWLPRRLKSLQCGVVVVALLNLAVFLAMTGTRVERGRGQGARLRVTRLEPHVVRTQSSLRHLITRGTHTGNSSDLTDKAVCSFRTTSYLFNAPLPLNQEPFLSYVKQMKCLEKDNVAHFGNVFTVFRNTVVDSSQVRTRRRGGEQMDQVWSQAEDDEYIKPLEGYFAIPCDEPPKMRFRPKDHLNGWNPSLVCYDHDTQPSTGLVVKDFTLAIQRYEYVNLYHTMCEFYNAFVLMILFGVRPSKFNILFVDTHPIGNLDPVWGTLFGKVLRAGQLESPVMFHTLSWGMLGYFSPLNDHTRVSVPYLEEFRRFFLEQHNVSTNHTIDCGHINVVFIWRHNYVAHPRNQKGSVVRKFANEAEMLTVAQQALGPHANVSGYQLDQMPMKAQLEVIAKCDILIGMHGAGLSHILFLPKTSAVLEMKPVYSNPALTHFEAQAKWRGIPYSIWFNENRANEESDYKTHIPKDVLTNQVKALRDSICNKKSVSDTKVLDKV